MISIEQSVIGVLLVACIVLVWMVHRRDRQYDAREAYYEEALRDMLSIDEGHPHAAMALKALVSLALHDLTYGN